MSIKRIVVSPRDLVQPYFALAGRSRKEKIPNMPGIYRMSSDLIERDVKTLLGVGINKILLFGIARFKDPFGFEAIDVRGAIQHTTSQLRNRFGKRIKIITDVCLCGFTDHGHCGILKGKKIDRKKTRDRLGAIAVSHARAGADFVAPSAMTVGQVKAVRRALNRAGFHGVKIWAYAIKYASVFYGPFRDALDSAPRFGDRRAYQMDPSDIKGVLSAALEDQKSGADVLMVKPALPYLDILFKLKQRAKVPVAAYHVSGEYSMIKSAAGSGVVNERKAVLECLTGIKRAGADLIVTYYAREAAKWLENYYD